MVPLFEPGTTSAVSKVTSLHAAESETPVEPGRSGAARAAGAADTGPSKIAAVTTVRRADFITRPALSTDSGQRETGGWRSDAESRDQASISTTIAGTTADGANFA